MANVVWHEKLRIHLDLTRDDLDHPELPDLWNTIYATDRLYAVRSVPVSQRGLQCGGICQEAGVVAWMHLRLRANGRREAVHEKAEDEARHSVSVSDEHKAYQERILQTAVAAGFSADSEVRTRVGRSWIQTDTLVEGADGRRLGWEVQLSSAGQEGPRSVRARASKAAKHGITPLWHTDRSDYAHRNDTQWTRSNNLPAPVIAKTGDLRVISGFRALDFWRCDIRALYPCPNGQRRCGKHHVTPKPRDVLFDDLVRKTAAGAIVPVEHRTGSTTHRFWVTSTDRDRLEDLRSDDTVLPPLSDKDIARGASSNRPTCRPATADPPSVPLPVATPPNQLTAIIPRQMPPALSSRAELATAPSPAVQVPQLSPSPLPPGRILNWQASSHWSFEAGPCRYCRKFTNLVDSHGVHAHKVCAEEGGGE
ncbi:hypothetical protein OG949_41105 (plasmid) [Streptomyces scopuliridis]|uniref:hypothetical protein n=1 Tax=Streptomyces scopuliridis TaxID=452529 RepID=UPI002DDAD54E|nr:hypothetical protein [Streptomyces scopuliridis]WSB39141.1 hypothetical protein OG949_41105 [Streptomyces scopuliridis]